LPAGPGPGRRAAAPGSARENGESSTATPEYGPVDTSRLPDATAGASGDFPAERWQGVEDGLAVALSHHPAIEQGDGAAVGLGAQQAATGLNQAQGGVWHGDLHERIAATRLDPFGQ